MQIDNNGETEVTDIAKTILDESKALIESISSSGTDCSILISLRRMYRLTVEENIALKEKIIITNNSFDRYQELREEMIYIEEILNNDLKESERVHECVQRLLNQKEAYEDLIVDALDRR